MPISKGFLIQKHELKVHYIVGGLILWILCSYILYAFFQMFREAFRFYTGYLGDSHLVILTSKGNYLYNLFYASISSALGYSIALRFVLQNSFYLNSVKTRSLIRRTLNIEGFYTWGFLFWFGKLGSILGIWYMIYAMQYDLNILQEFSFFLLGLPLILFYSSWPNFNRLIRINKGTWLLVLTGIFLFMSFLFAFKNFTNYKKFNQDYLNRTIEFVYDFKVPKTQSHQKIHRRSAAIDLYVVRDSIEINEPVIFINNISTRVYLEDILETIKNERNMLHDMRQHEFIINLHIDERLTLHSINPIFRVLRKSDHRLRIQFSTGRKYSRYPSSYPHFKYKGIQKALLPRRSHEFESFLDSVENIDLKGKKFRLSDSHYYRNGFVKEKNRIEISLSQNAVTLNGQEIDSIKLEQLVYRFIKNYSPNYAIIFNSDEDITYGRYIEYLDLLHTQIDRLKRELYLEQTGKPYENEFWSEQIRATREKYPIYIIEWSKEEKRLDDLIKKTN